MKKLFYILVIMVTLLISENVFASSLDFYASATTVYVGDSVAVTATMSNIEGKFSITSSNTDILNGGKVTDWLEGGSVSAYFTAQSPGTASVTLTPIAASTMDPGNEKDFYETRTVTIYVINRPEQPPVDINKVYSDNNFLSSLQVEGYELKEGFDKEKSEYSLEVDYTVEKINILTSLEDQTANVIGAGEVDLVEGNNEIKIIVQAENGNERTYIINVLVKEFDPIEITVNNQKYTILKNDKLLPEVEGFEKTAIMINDVEIPALYNEIADYMLVGLKTDKGKVKLFIYNSKDNTYTEFKELKLSGIKLNYLTPENHKYKAVDIEINGKKIKAYKKEGIDYYLIYGMNLETGNINWYTYDKEENTLQRYIENEEDVLEAKQSSFVIILLGSISAVLIIFLLILAFKKNKNIF